MEREIRLLKPDLLHEAANIGIIFPLGLKNPYNQSWKREERHKQQQTMGF